MISVGDIVKYSGSLKEYHPYDFEVLELFEFEGIECAMLSGPESDIWIKRCRVSNLTKVENAHD